MISKFFKFIFNWKVFLTLNCLILFTKIVLSFYQGFSEDYYEDFRIADNLANHGIYSWNLQFGSSAYKLPLYPLFLAFFIKLFGVSTAVKLIVVLQHIFYFLIPVLIVKSFKNFKLDHTGFLAAYFFIFSPSYFYYSNIFEATNIFILLLLIWLFLYSKFWIKTINTSKLILFSIITGLLALAQVVAVPVVGMMILLLIIHRKLSLKRIFVVIFISALVYSPWVIRNYITFDKIILSKTPVWQNVYVGYLQENQICKNNHFFAKSKEEKLNEILAVNDEFTNEVIFKTEVKNLVAKDKMAPLKKGINNFISLWYVPAKYYKNTSLSVLLGRKIYVLVINLLLAFSLLYFIRKKYYTILIFSGLLIVGFTVPYLIGHAANIRFKLDFEWIQTSVIAFMIIDFITKYKSQKVQEFCDS